MKKYTKEEFLKAAEIGEVSMIDAKHVVSLLDEAKYIMKVGFESIFRWWHNMVDSFCFVIDSSHSFKKSL